MLPFFTGMCSTENLQGLIAIAVVILANVFMIGRCINLYRTMEVKAARRVMFGSYLYLPLILFALLLSKAATA
jgi:protoheme IX farnesyltransferase